MATSQELSELFNKFVQIYEQDIRNKKKEEKPSKSECTLMPPEDVDMRTSGYIACMLCNVVCSGPKNYVQHMTSGPHVAKYTEATSTQCVKHLFGKDQYYCMLCRADLSGGSAIQQHLVSVQHNRSRALIKQVQENFGVAYVRTDLNSNDHMLRSKEQQICEHCGSIVSKHIPHSCRLAPQIQQGFITVREPFLAKDAPARACVLCKRYCRQNGVHLCRRFGNPEMLQSQEYGDDVEAANFSTPSIVIASLDDPDAIIDITEPQIQQGNGKDDATDCAIGACFVDEVLTQIWQTQEGSFRTSYWQQPALEALNACFSPRQVETITRYCVPRNTAIDRSMNLQGCSSCNQLPRRDPRQQSGCLCGPLTKSYCLICRRVHRARPKAACMEMIHLTGLPQFQQGNADEREITEVNQDTGVMTSAKVIMPKAPAGAISGGISFGATEQVSAPELEVQADPDQQNQEAIAKQSTVFLDKNIIRKPRPARKARAIKSIRQDFDLEHIKRILGKAIQFDTIEITTTNGAADNIVKWYSVPWDLLKDDSVTHTNLHHQMVNIFTYFQMDAEITIQYKGNPNQMGQVIVAWLPPRKLKYMPSPTQLTAVGRFEHAPLSGGRTFVPNFVLLNCAKSNTVTFTIPFQCIINALDTKSRVAQWQNEFGRMYVGMLNQFRPPVGGTTAFNMSLFVSWKNFVPLGPRPPYLDAPSLLLSREDKHRLDTIKELEEGKITPAEFMRATNIQFQQGLLSETTQEVVSAASEVVDGVGSALQAGATIADTLAESAGGIFNLLEMFGLHRPIIDDKDPEGFAMSQATGQTILNVRDRNEVFGMNRNVVTGVRDEWVVGDQPEYLEELCQIPMMVYRINVTTAQKATNILFKGRVHPMIYSNWNEKWANAAWPPCQMFSLPMESWRGDMNYHIQVICPEPVKARLLIAHCYGRQLGDDIDFQQATSYPNTTVDIDGSVDLVYTTKHINAIDYCMTQPPQADVIPTPDPATSFITTNGVLLIGLQQQITAPTICPNMFEINIWVSSGQDYLLGPLGLPTLVRFSKKTPTPPPKAQVQQGLVSTNVMTECHYGEVHSHIPSILKKPMQAYYIPGRQEAKDGSGLMLQLYDINKCQLDNNYYAGIQELIRMHFQWEKGGRRIKYVITPHVGATDPKGVSREGLIHAVGQTNSVRADNIPWGDVGMNLGLSYQSLEYVNLFEYEARWYVEQNQRLTFRPDDDPDVDKRNAKLYNQPMIALMMAGADFDETATKFRWDKSLKMLTCGSDDYVLYNWYMPVWMGQTLNKTWDQMATVEPITWDQKPHTKSGGASRRPEPQFQQGLGDDDEEGLIQDFQTPPDTFTSAGNSPTSTLADLPLAPPTPTKTKPPRSLPERFVGSLISPIVNPLADASNAVLEQMNLEEKMAKWFDALDAKVHQSLTQVDLHAEALTNRLKATSLVLHTDVQTTATSLAHDINRVSDNVVGTVDLAAHTMLDASHKLSATVDSSMNRVNEAVKFSMAQGSAVIQEVKASAEEVLDKTDGVLDKVTTLVDRVMPDKPTETPTPQRVMNLVMHAIKITAAKDWKALMLELIHVCVSVPDLKWFGDLISENIFKPLQMMMKAQVPQSAEDVSLFTVLYSAMSKIFEIVGYPIAKFDQIYKANKSFIDSYLTLGRFLQSTRTIASFLPWVSEVVMWVYDKIRTFMGFQTDDNTMTKISKLVDAFDKFYQESSAQGFVWKDAHLLELAKMTTAMTDLATKATKIKNGASISHQLNIAKMRASMLYATGAKKINAKPYRVDPFCVSFYGGSGVGKSAMIMKFCTDYITYIGEDLENGVISKNEAVEFFDGYNYNPVVVFDDMHQHKKDGKGEQFLIMAKSNTMFQINQADLSDKGKQFNSKLIVLTTNTKAYTENDKVTHPEAIERRKDLKIEVQLHPDYKSKLDAKMDMKRVMESVDVRHLQFQVYKKDTGSDATLATSHWMSYEQMFKAFAINYDEHMDRQESLIENYSKPSQFLHEFKEEREKSREYEREQRKPFFPDAQIQNGGVSEMEEEDSEYDSSDVDNMAPVELEAIRQALKTATRNARRNRTKARCRKMTPSEEREYKTMEEIKMQEIVKSTIGDKVTFIIAKMLDLGLNLCKATLRRMLFAITGGLPFIEVDEHGDMTIVGPQAAFLHELLYEEIAKPLGLKEGENIKEIFVAFDLLSPAMICVGVSEPVKVSDHQPYADRVKEAMDKLNSQIKQHKSYLEQLLEKIWEHPKMTALISFMGLIGAAWLTRSTMQTKVDKWKSRVQVQQGYLTDKVDEWFEKKITNPAWVEARAKQYEMEPEAIVKIFKEVREVTRPTEIQAEEELQRLGYLQVENSAYEMQGQLRKDFRSKLSSTRPKSVEQAQIQQGLTMETALGVAGCRDDNAENVRLHRVMPNMVLIARLKDDVNVDDKTPGKRLRTVKGQGIAIRGTCILLNKHVSKLFKLGDMVALYRQISKMPHVDYFAFDPDRVWEHPDKDLAVWYIGLQTTAWKNIVHLFIKEEDLRMFEGAQHVVNPRLNWNPVEFDSVVSMAKSIDEAQMLPPGLSEQWFIDHKDDWENYTTRYTGVFGYSSNAKGGHSGSPVLCYQARLPRKIIGIHCSKGCGPGSVGAFVTQEVLEEMIAELEMKTGQKLVHNLVPNIDHILRPDIHEPQFANAAVLDEMYPRSDCGNIVPIGILEPKLAPGSIEKTAYRKTPLFDLVYPHTTRPTLTWKEVNQAQIEDPHKVQCEKYGTTVFPVVGQLAKAIEADMKRITLEAARKGKYRPAQKQSNEEVIKGSLAYKHITGLNPKASMGYPYCLKAKQAGKRDFFDFDQGTIINEDFRIALEYREAQGRRGERVPSVWIDCAKDARVKNEKVAKGKQRAFVIAPACHSFLVKKYCGDFIAALMESHNDSCFAIGINPAGPEWMNLFRRLFKWGGANCRAGDQSQFDGRVMAQHVMWLCEVVNEFYDEDMKHSVDPVTGLPYTQEDLELDHAMRRILFAEMVQCIHIFFNRNIGIWVAYMTTHGNPSGNVFTTILNSFSNGCDMRMAYVEIAQLGRTGYSRLTRAEQLRSMSLQEYSSLVNMRAYNQNVTESYFGDDDVGESSPRVLWFNMHNIAIILRAHGLDYTTVEKNDKMVDFFDYTQLRYLKRKFVPDAEYPDHIMHAPMDPEPIRELVNWYKVSDNQQEALQSNILDFMRFMGDFSKEEFDKEVESVQSACYDLGIDVPYYSWDDYRYEKLIAHGLIENETPFWCIPGVSDYNCNLPLEEE
nr:MAG: nonstructural protein [Riboviria sp.]WKV34003.1 MAG: RNA-dependent RNA polymerase [Riboviria sp.]